MKCLNTLKYILPRKRCIRQLSTIPSFVTKQSDEALCTQAVKDAEKIVGYPTSFLSLRWLLNDEVANIALHIRKLVGTNHPLLSTARDLLLSREVPAWGLIVLLISKAGGIKSPLSHLEYDVTAGILHSQRVLAEVTEMIRTSNIVHNSLLNIENKAEEELLNVNFGNKIALLTGDYLLSSSFRELAGLKNQEVNEIVSATLRDLAESQFIEPRDSQNRPLPSKPLPIQEDIEIANQFGTDPVPLEKVLGNCKSEWTLRHLLGGASLLAKCCQGALRLAGHSDELQEHGYVFGRNMALAWQARIDAELFKDGVTGPFSLISAPVMFHLRHDPSFYDEIIKGQNGVEKVDYEYIREVVKEGPGLDETTELKKEFSDKALDVLNEFNDNEAKNALVNMINSL